MECPIKFQFRKYRWIQRNMKIIIISSILSAILNMCQKRHHFIGNYLLQLSWMKKRLFDMWWNSYWCHLVSMMLQIVLILSRNFSFCRFHDFSKERKASKLEEKIYACQFFWNRKFDAINWHGLIIICNFVQIPI